MLLLAAVDQVRLRAGIMAALACLNERLNKQPRPADDLHPQQLQGQRAHRHDVVGQAKLPTQP